MKRVEVGSGIAMATFAAGPVFIVLITIGTLLFDTPPPRGVWMQAMGMLTLLLVAIPVGTIGSLVPNLVGGLLMASLGTHYRTMRLRRVWALAGAVLGAAIIVPIGGIDSPGAAQGYALFALTGALCALIVRYGTRWLDETA